MSNHLSSDLVNRRLVDPELVSYVKAVGKEHEAVLRQHPGIDFDRVMSSRTMGEFDDAAGA